MKRSTVVLIMTALVMLGGGYGLGNSAGQTSERNRFNQQYPLPLTYQAPRELVTAAQHIGLDVNELVATRAQIGFTAYSCNPKTLVGCYSEETGRLAVGVNAFTESDPNQTLAYEYEHYVWQHLPNKATYEPELSSLYSTLLHNPNFATDNQLFLSEGSIGSEAFYSEMFSTACTTTDRSKVSAQLQAACYQEIAKPDSWRRVY